ncbi:MAG: hypothetical protein J6P61_03550 [Erysipelotrichaceae bacterium]|nr:hypothetical protein [Erysipelotrichaceae bacterium]
MSKTVNYSKNFEFVMTKKVKAMTITDSSSERTIPLSDYPVGSTRSFSINGELLSIKSNSRDYNVIGMVRKNVLTITFDQIVDTMKVKENDHYLDINKVKSIKAGLTNLTIETDEKENKPKPKPDPKPVNDKQKEYETKLKALEDDYKKRLNALENKNKTLTAELEDLRKNRVDASLMVKLTDDKQAAEDALKAEKAAHKATKALIKGKVEKQIETIKANKDQLESSIKVLVEELEKEENEKDNLEIKKAEAQTKKDELVAINKIMTMDIEAIENDTAELKARFASDDALITALNQNESNWINLDVDDDIDGIKKTIEKIENKVVKIIQIREKVNHKIVDLQTTNNNDGTITTDEEIGR